MFSVLANFVRSALTFSLVVARGLMYGEMSSKVHLSLAAKRTERRSWTFSGNKDSGKCLMTGDSGLVSSTRQRPDSWERHVVMPSGTVCAHILLNSDRLYAVEVLVEVRRYQP